MASSLSRTASWNGQRFVAMGAAAVASLRRLLKGFRTFGLMKKLVLLSIVGPGGVRNRGGDFLGTAHPGD